MTVLTEAPANLPNFQLQDSGSSNQKYQEACLQFNGKIKRAPREAPGYLPALQCKIMTVLTEASKACLIFNSKIMTVLTEAPAKVPNFQLQDNDSSDGSTSKPAYFSMAR